MGIKIAGVDSAAVLFFSGGAGFRENVVGAPGHRAP